MTHDDETVERVARAIAATQVADPKFSRFDRDGEASREMWRRYASAALSALPPRDELLREALAYAHQLEQCVAEFLDAYTAFNNDELDEVSMNDAEHGMKLAMYAFREARAAADKIRAALGGEQT